MHNTKIRLTKEEKYLDKLYDEFKSILKRHIPNLMIESCGYSGSNFDAKLSDKNKLFIGSDYFFNKGKKFVHWTSIQNLMSILNYREFRFYNLHNSSDEKEFKYAAQQFGITNESIEYSKSYLYTLSFCESKEITNEYLWTEYGKDYSGVAIEFEIVNDPQEWKNYMLSQVYYQIPAFVSKLKEEFEMFKNKYPGATAHIDLGKLIAFHKQKKFSKELEIRIATYYPFKNVQEIEKYCNTEFRFEKDRPRETNYFGLKLWVNSDSPFIREENPQYDRSLNLEKDYFIHNPKIKITNIYFGKNCGISSEEFIKFWGSLNRIVKFKLGYNINIEPNLYG